MAVFGWTQGSPSVVKPRLLRQGQENPGKTPHLPSPGGLVHAVLLALKYGRMSQFKGLGHRI
jgi:hypothetical protein